MEAESRKSPEALINPGAPGAVCCTEISRPASGYGRGFSSTPFTTLKTAVLAPIPMARVRIPAAAKPGLLRSVRRENRTLRAISSRNESVFIRRDERPFRITDKLITPSKDLPHIDGALPQ